MDDVTMLLFLYEGLEYLHEGCTPKIIHRDVKTANILLNYNLNGKLSDFGLSRMALYGDASHVTTVVKGTFGYFDPEYITHLTLTQFPISLCLWNSITQFYFMFHYAYLLNSY